MIVTTADRLKPEKASWGVSTPAPRGSGPARGEGPGCWRPMRCVLPVVPRLARHRAGARGGGGLRADPPVGARDDGQRLVRGPDRDDETPAEGELLLERLGDAAG